MLIFNYILLLKNEIFDFIYKNMRLLKFSDFIFEKYSGNLEAPFVMSPDFVRALDEIDSPISSALISKEFSPSDISLITFGQNGDFIKYTPVSKISEILNTKDSSQLSTLVRPLHRFETEIYHKMPTEARVGRFIRKVFSSMFSDKQVEDFVNKYKSLNESKKLNFELWSDYQILDGYKSQNFTHERGSTNPLMNSCMNDELEYVEFYRYLPVRLLVLVNSEGHIFGRALIWKTDVGYFMDRVYTAYDSDYYKFVNWAKDNGVIYKAENKSGSRVEYMKDGKKSWFPMSVKLNFDVEGYQKDSYSEEATNFPYLDTFIYGQKNILTNDEPVEGNFYVFQDTDGGFLEVIVRYDIYGNRIDMSEIDDYVYSEIQQGWIYYRDCKYVKSVGDYLSFDFLDNPKNGFIWDQEQNNYIKVSK